MLFGHLLAAGNLLQQGCHSLRAGLQPCLLQMGKLCSILFLQERLQQYMMGLRHGGIAWFSR